MERKFISHENLTSLLYPFTLIWFLFNTNFCAWFLMKTLYTQNYKKSRWKFTDEFSFFIIIANPPSIIGIRILLISSFLSCLREFSKEFVILKLQYFFIAFVFTPSSIGISLLLAVPFFDNCNSLIILGFLKNHFLSSHLIPDRSW